MQCFCGCGRKVTVRLRPTNKRGERLRRDVRRIEQLLDVGLDSPNATMFVEQANDWVEVFAASVHEHTKPDDVQPGFSQVYLGWLAAVKPFVSVTFLGKRIRDEGVSAEEAADLMSRGELDPWADVQMPVPASEVEPSP